jgi:enterochelin esterase-like enzyme
MADMPPVMLPPHAEVHGVEVAQVEVNANGAGWEPTSWAELDRRVREPGVARLRASVAGGTDGADVQVPPCAGRREVTVDGAKVASPDGPVVIHVGPGGHEVEMALKVSPYERRIACGQAIRVGKATPGTAGLGVLSFPSPNAGRGGGQAVVFVPEGHEASKPAAVLVGLHPWNGSMWTYASYDELLHEAAVKDVVLLMQSGLGNALYVADAEDEAMRAIDALAAVIAVDPRRVSLWGASMGGAGATTVGFHHPDRFASVTSYFGDSKYDMSSYVKGILHDDAGAHAVNAFDVVDNARWLNVRLIHGTADVTSNVAQSDILAAELTLKGFSFRYERMPGRGHEGRLVAEFLREVVWHAAVDQVPVSPPRVTYRSVRPWDTGAYGVHLARASETGDAFIDVEQVDHVVHVRRADGVRALTIDPGALGTDATHPLSIVNDTGHALNASWTGGSP